MVIPVRHRAGRATAMVGGMQAGLWSTMHIRLVHWSLALDHRKRSIDRDLQTNPRSAIARRLEAETSCVHELYRVSDKAVWSRLKQTSVVIMSNDFANRN